MLQKAASFANDGAKFEIYLFEMGRDPFAAPSFHRAEQLIAPYQA
jgi:hypothetical protein